MASTLSSKLDTALAGTYGYAPPARADLLCAAGERHIIAAVALPSIVADAEDGVRTDLFVAAFDTGALLLWEGGPAPGGGYTSSILVVPRASIAGVDVTCIRDGDGSGDLQSVAVVVRTTTTGSDVRLDGLLHEDDEGATHAVLEGSIDSECHLLVADNVTSAPAAVADLFTFAGALSAWMVSR